LPLPEVVLTLLVGVATRKGVWIGADSGSIGGTFSQAVPEPKVWRDGAWLVSVGGSWRALELVRHAVKMPTAPRSVADAHKVVCLDVLDEIRTAFTARGYAPEPGEDDAAAWYMLLGVRCALRGQPVLFYVEDDHAESVPCAAVGQGEEYALGRLSGNAHMDPAARVRDTLKATRERFGLIRPPYRVESL
jgi:hypothetical protein